MIKVLLANRADRNISRTMGSDVEQRGSFLGENAALWS